MRIAVVLLVLACMAAPARAQDAAELANTVERTIDAHRRAQAALDTWAAEQAELEARRQTAAAHIEYLEKRRAFEAEQVKALGTAIDGLQKQLDQFAESIDRHEHLADTLAVIVSRLDAFVASDLPFRRDERMARVNELKAVVSADTVSAGEKLRRVFEVLDAEAQYASGVETYKERVTVAGASVDAGVLRLGRVALYWRSDDGTRVGEFDRAGRQWVELPESNARDIARAMEMATGDRKSEIVLLPLGKVER
jgi:hypothetical protein